MQPSICNMQKLYAMLDYFWQLCELHGLCQKNTEWYRTMTFDPSTVCGCVKALTHPHTVEGSKVMDKEIQLNYQLYIRSYLRYEDQGKNGCGTAQDTNGEQSSEEILKSFQRIKGDYDDGSHKVGDVNCYGNILGIIQTLQLYFSDREG